MFWFVFVFRGTGTGAFCLKGQTAPRLHSRVGKAGGLHAAVLFEVTTCSLAQSCVLMETNMVASRANLTHTILFVYPLVGVRLR